MRDHMLCANRPQQPAGRIGEARGRISHFGVRFRLLLFRVTEQLQKLNPFFIVLRDVVTTTIRSS